MVIGGYSEIRELKDPNTNKCLRDENGQCKMRPGLINDVELLSLSDKNKKCSKFVAPVFGASYILGEDELGPIVENEAELLGMTGFFTKDAAIICGGKNGDGDQARCFEWDPSVNTYEFLSSIYHFCSQE